MTMVSTEDLIAGMFFAEQTTLIAIIAALEKRGIITRAEVKKELDLLRNVEGVDRGEIADTILELISSVIANGVSPEALRAGFRIIDGGKPLSDPEPSD